MTESRWQVRDIKWWHKPRPLMQRNPNGDGWKQIGYVWNQRAYMVNNLIEGWIAFIEDQTPDKIDLWVCPYCSNSMDHFHQQKIIDSVRAAAALKEKT
ncbi:MAG: hypothetical protein J0H69_17170 [Burkholderiales bacterium]|nr:hypothetical protein [Burkholderiales bacterium]